MSVLLDYILTFSSVCLMIGSSLLFVKKYKQRLKRVMCIYAFLSGVLGILIDTLYYASEYLWFLQSDVIL